MKWIKTAIGAVIAISVLPLVVLSVLNIKESLEIEKITVTTELEHDEDLYGWYAFNHTIHFDDLSDYFEMGYTIANLYDYTNDINITITDRYYYEPTYIQIFDNNSVYYDFYGTNMKIPKTYENIYNANLSDMGRMDITLSRSRGNLVTTLLPCISIIFAGGVVLYIYKSFKKD